MKWLIRLQRSPPMTTLKPNSIPNEYYFGDFPGTIQYKKDAQELMAMDTSLPLTPQDGLWTSIPLTEEIKHRLLPHTQGLNNWTLIMAMQKAVCPIHGDIWLKGAFVNTTTGEIALLTSANSQEAIVRSATRPGMKTYDGTYYVGRYRMGAPAIFWKTLQAILLSRA